MSHFSSFCLVSSHFKHPSSLLKHAATKITHYGPRLIHCQSVTRLFSSDSLSDRTRFVPFQDNVKQRMNEAKRSIIVQVQSAQSYKELHTYCSSLGNVSKMFHYSTGVEPLHFILVEFKKETDVNSIKETATYLTDGNVVPVQSQFLWFRASNKQLGKLKQSKNAKLDVENGLKKCSDEELKIRLKKCDNVSEQIMELYKSSKLNDMGTRLRFLTARQVETCVSGMFPNAKAFPFGSTVNGFGKMGCDLDLVLRLNNEHQDAGDSRLIFHCKASHGSERTTSQRNMEAMGDLLQLFLPGCAQVRRILQARVPIIKYYQQLTDVECDLSMSNMSGVHMSDFLYIMGEMDPRVRPLIYSIRKWASDVGLTSASPGRWITNFSLTLLVLSFLQRPLSSPPVLPSFNTLIRSAEAKDKYTTEDGINCTFLRDIKKLHHKTQNTESLASLLCEFFEYYSQFDFTSKAICLNEALPLTKPEHCAMYIVNPLERGLNVSKNVSLEELDKFRKEARTAAWLLESQNGESKEENSGLLSIFQRKKSAPFVFPVMPKTDRLMNVTELFEAEENTKNIDFKNGEMKKAVSNIKNETKKNIKELQKKFDLNR